jgi:4'-phosphopantetheinyl transferase
MTLLTADEVHLWLADLGSVEPIEACRSVLSEEEQARAATFRFDHDRQHFITRRAILRRLVGNYHGIAPARIEFRNDVHGKPQLGTRGGRTLQFNLSSTERWAMYAFALDRRVGIDVERARSSVDWEEIASQFFHMTELAAIRQVAEKLRYQEFLSYWTMKEAIMKARGTGLDRALLQTDITSVVRDGRKEFIDSDDVKWLCTPIALDSDLKAALASEA